MKISEERTPEGLTSIKWVQLMTAGSVFKRTRRYWMLGGAAVGIITGIGDGVTSMVQGALMGALGGLILLGLSLAKGATPQGLRHLEKPVLKKVKAEAEIERHADGRLYFSWMFRTPSGELVGNVIPIEDFESFELGSSSEWFSGQHEQDDFHNMFVIMLHSRTQGSLCVAAHAGAKADVTTLHAALTRAYVSARQLTLTKPPERPRAAHVLRDDLPTTL